MLVQLYSAALFAATHPCGLDARDGDIDALAQMSWPVGLQIPLSRTTCFIRGPSRGRPATSAGRHDAEAPDFTGCADHARSLKTGRS